MAEEHLKDWTDEELVMELARRRASSATDGIYAFERDLLGTQINDGKRTLDELLRARSEAETTQPKPCPRCKVPARVRRRQRSRPLRSVLGTHRYLRNYHYCDACKFGFSPLDDELGLPSEGEVTPELERRLLDFGINDAFEHAAERWKVHYQVEASDNLFRRVVERCGQKLDTNEDTSVFEALLSGPEENTPVLTVAIDGSMLPTRGEEQWKEAKVGVLVRSGHHSRGSDSRRGIVTQARYVGHLGGIDVFRQRLSAALTVEHAEDACKVVWLGDGAPWIWNLLEELCPQAIGILDWTHAVQYAETCAKVLFPNDSHTANLWVDRIKRYLMDDAVDALLSDLNSCRFGSSAEVVRAIADLSRYYTTNRARMHYPRYLKAGLPIGSGIVESAHDHVLQQRMKCAGQHWALGRGDRMVQLRAAYKTTGPENLYDSLRAIAA